MVKIMIGIDCDFPRGDYIQTEEGQRMAAVVIASLETITSTLIDLHIPWTYFVCGLFLENMAAKYGAARVQAAFAPEHPLCEIGDHTYSHIPLKAIPTRPDKPVMSPDQLRAEFAQNTRIFQDILQVDLPRRGFRSPLGHYQGLQGETGMLQALQNSGATYISTDLRDARHSLNPPLTENGTVRQPYQYPNGLWEVPSHGWQDTVYEGFSKTPVFEPYPQTYDEMLIYYQNLITEAQSLANPFFLGLSLHPYNISQYGQQGKFFQDLKALADDLGAGFCQYQQAIMGKEEI